MGMGSSPIIHIQSGVIAAIVESTTRILVVRNEATLYFGLYLYGQRPTPCPGRADVLEIHPNDTIVPVEYKAGVPHGKAADLQLCAQALCLEDMLQVPVTEGFVWYSRIRRRHRVAFDLQLRHETLKAVDNIRSQLVSGQLPSAPNDTRCKECQLLDHCLPSVVSNPHNHSLLHPEDSMGTMNSCGT